MVSEWLRRQARRLGGWAGFAFVDAEKAKHIGLTAKIEIVAQRVEALESKRNPRPRKKGAR
jgi:hypothetical protein